MGKFKTTAGQAVIFRATVAIIVPIEGAVLLVTDSAIALINKGVAVGVELCDMKHSSQVTTIESMWDPETQNRYKFGLEMTLGADAVCYDVDFPDKNLAFKDPGKDKAEYSTSLAIYSSGNGYRPDLCPRINLVQDSTSSFTSIDIIAIGYSYTDIRWYRNTMSTEKVGVRLSLASDISNDEENCIGVDNVVYVLKKQWSSM